MGHNEQLKALELSIQKRTTNMMSQVGSSGSLDSLIKIIRCLGDTNQDVVGLLVRSRDDIHGSQELKELLLDYFSCSHKILEFLNTLHAWLHGGAGVSWRLGRVKSALQSYKSDKTRTGYGRELLQRALNGFMEANDPLVAEQLRAKLRSVMDEQSRLYDRLRAKKHKIEHDNRERFLLCRKVTVAVLASVYVGLMLCAAVTAALTPALVITPVAVLAAVAAMNPTDYTKTCMNHVLVKYEDKINRRSELVNALMEANSRITLEDLEGIRHVVVSLRDHISSLSAAPPNIRNNSVVNAVIGEMERKIDEFAKAVKDLESRKTKCYKDVMDARGKIFRTTCGKNS